MNRIVHKHKPIRQLEIRQPTLPCAIFVCKLRASAAFCQGKNFRVMRLFRQYFLIIGVHSIPACACRCSMQWINQQHQVKKSDASRCHCADQFAAATYANSAQILALRLQLKHSISDIRWCRRMITTNSNKECSLRVFFAKLFEPVKWRNISMQKSLAPWQ